MSHPRDIEWIQLQAGHLPEPEAHRLRNHLTGCAACRDKVDELERVWQAMRPPRCPPLRNDLSGAVLARLPAPHRDVLARIGPWLRHVPAAAAVLLAIGLGHWAGRWMHPPASGGPSIEAAAAEVLRLDEVGSDQTLLLSQTLEDLGTVDEEPEISG